jgi:hypothetical protein
MKRQPFLFGVFNLVSRPTPVRYILSLLLVFVMLGIQPSPAVLAAAPARPALDLRQVASFPQPALFGSIAPWRASAASARPYAWEITLCTARVTSSSTWRPNSSPSYRAALPDRWWWRSTPPWSR